MKKVIKFVTEKKSVTYIVNNGYEDISPVISKEGIQSFHWIDYEGAGWEAKTEDAIYDLLFWHKWDYKSQPAMREQAKIFLQGYVPHEGKFILKNPNVQGLEEAVAAVLEAATALINY